MDSLQSFPLEIITEIGLYIDNLTDYLAYLSTCKYIHLSDRFIHSVKREQLKTWHIDCLSRSVRRDNKDVTIETIARYNTLPNGMKDGFYYEWEKESNELGKWWNKDSPGKHSHSSLLINGVKHGPWFQELNDWSYIEGAYYNGLRHGPQTLFFNNSPVETIIYDHGKGIHTTTLRTGNVRVTEYNDSDIIRAITFYPDGKIQRYIDDSDRTNFDCIFDGLGNIESVSYITDSGSESWRMKGRNIVGRLRYPDSTKVYKEYDVVTEKLVEEYTLNSNGRLHGVYNRWYRGTNQLKSQSHFVNGLKHGVYRRWYQGTNQIMKQYPFMNGKRHGLYEKWSIDGILISSKLYENDAEVQCIL